jgi:hypothetical protein
MHFTVKYFNQIKDLERDSQSSNKKSIQNNDLQQSLKVLLYAAIRM